jgi:hypothetical protein
MNMNEIIEPYQLESDREIIDMKMPYQIIVSGHADRLTAISLTGVPPLCGFHRAAIIACDALNARAVT